MTVTLRRMRAPGLAWRRMPLFAWAATVISYVLLVIGPIMLAALTMLFIDRRFDGIFFDRARAGRRCSTSTSPTSSSPART